MAKQDVNFIDKHLEKVILGTCGAVLLGAAWFAFSGTRFSVGEHSPAELSKSLDEAAEQTRQAMLSARYNPPKKETSNPKDDPIAELDPWYGESPKGLRKIAGLQEPPPRAQSFPPLFNAIMKTSPEDRRELVKLVPPGPPLVTSGRTTFELFRNLVDMTGYDPRNHWTGTDAYSALKNWVSVAAQIDLLDLNAKFIEQHYSIPFPLPIVKIHLQRKDLTDTSRGWEDVEPFLPYAPTKRPVPTMQADGRVVITGLESYRTTVEEGSSLIITPPLPERKAGDKPELPAVPYLDEPPSKKTASADDASRRIKKWTDLAKAALSGKRPFKEPDPIAALILARAAVATTGAKDKDAELAKSLLAKVIPLLPKKLQNEAKATPKPPEKLMPIMAHDVTALPGHTYVYRIRYEMVNPFAGNSSELKDSRDAARLTIFSDWSPESRPVEITSDTYFYLTKVDKAKKEARVVVYKVKGKNVLAKQEYKLTSGEEIGKKEKGGNKPDFSTGAVCVDIDFDREVDGKKETALVYVDRDDGTLHERFLSRDKKDKNHIKLEEFKPPAEKP